jgi:head-tail adaptor
VNFRHRVTFYSDVSNDDTVEPSWVIVSNLSPPYSTANWPCNIRPTAGGEVIYGQQLQEETTILIECRWAKDIEITNRMRAKNDVTSDWYEINHVRNVHLRNRFLLLECTEVDD